MQIIILISHPLHLLGSMGKTAANLLIRKQKSLMSLRGVCKHPSYRAVGPSRSHLGWYDLRNPGCSKTDARCFSHAMTEQTCLQRLEAFNGNLTISGGHALDA